MKEIKSEIYAEILEFLQAYQSENFKVLEEKFDIRGEFLEEIYEMLDFVEDKNTLHLCAFAEMEKISAGQPLLEIFEFNKNSKSYPSYGVECVLFMKNEDIGYIKGEYHTDGTFPKFLFHYFSI